jgi:hypothetical protein
MYYPSTSDVRIMQNHWELVMTIIRLAICGTVLACVTILGCVANVDEPTVPGPPQSGEKKADGKSPAEWKKVPVGKNITLEIQGEHRRVRVNGEVCLREGLLEQLLTRKRTKEHEAILAADIDARELHLALTLAGAEPGKVVQFRPKLVPPSGTAIKVFLEYEEKGKTIRVPAQQWLRNIKTKKDFDTDWVFAGSILIPNPEDKTKKPFYGANDGDIIALVNFETSLLDVPFLNTKDNDDLLYQAHTERIPALKSPVAIILEPVIEKKK